MDKIDYLSSIPNQAEAFAITQIFNSQYDSILYISKDDREIFNIKDKLNWIFPEVKILVYRSWDQIPYDNVSPSKQIQSERIKTLYELLNNNKNKKIIILTSINAIIQKTIDKDFLNEHIIEISVNKIIDFNQLILKLSFLGYQRTSVVRDKAEFSVRGSIIDIFISDHDKPIRIDFFDNIIESIYIFDQTSQKRLEKLDSSKISINTSSELILNKKTIELFRKNFRQNFENYRLSEIYHKFSDNIIPPGGEQFIPFFFNNMQTLFSFIENTTIVLSINFTNLLEVRLENINDFYDARKNLNENFFLDPKKLFLNKDRILSFLKKYKVVQFLEYRNEKSIDINIKKIPNLSSIRKEIDFKFIKKFLKIHKNKIVIICCRSLGSLQRVDKIFYENINIKLNYIKNFSEIIDSEGFYSTILSIPDSLELDKFIMINEKSLFGYNISTREKRKNNKELFFEEINKLTKGSILVHSDYGLCRFLDIIKIYIDDSLHDCIQLEFADNQKLFLPVENLNYITKYTNDDEKNIRLDKLGTSYWQKRKAEAKKRIKEIAKKLISVAAKRLQSISYKINFNSSDYDKFSSTFPFIETDDQLSAIEDVINDFKKNHPSDRLIIGDVAFGKTEVIIRALFLAVRSGLQCIILVPTTLLAKQHYENFTKRFKPFDISIKQISRFVTNKDKLEIYENISDGSANIIVGTHALLNDKINFKKLGLIIYDEEQKLGTHQKEKLKEVAPKAHVISLSATPIPRTLSMSLSGIRDLSLILTAPYERLSVRTYVSPFDELTIIEAIKREIFGRKNGVFFVTPRKKDIPFLEKFIKENIPDIKYVVAHGKIATNILEGRISKFYNQQVPMMISTNIVENGLDLPHVNTIIIYRANLFSLSGIYQLKGRVGRSTKRGYAYITYNEQEMTDNGRKRLNIINSFDQLGSGFNIASQDLDMRGGGSIIGEEQSGFIREVGTELYHQMLEEEIIKQKQKVTNIKDTNNEYSFQPIIKIPEEIYIPDNYIDDLDLRISIYKRISSINNEEKNNQLMIELIDRFGKFPLEINNLFKLMEIKLLCWKNNIELIEFSRKGIVFGFYLNKPPNPEKLMKLGFAKNNNFNIRPDQKIFYDFMGELNEDRFILTKKLINKLK